MSFTNRTIPHKYKGKTINKSSSVYMKSYKIMLKTLSIEVNSILILLID